MAYDEDDDSDYIDNANEEDADEEDANEKDANLEDSRSVDSDCESEDFNGLFDVVDENFEYVVLDEVNAEDDDVIGDGTAEISNDADNSQLSNVQNESSGNRYVLAPFISIKAQGYAKCVIYSGKWFEEFGKNLSKNN